VYGPRVGGRIEDDRGFLEKCDPFYRKEVNEIGRFVPRTCLIGEELALLAWALGPEVKRLGASKMARAYL